MYSTVSASPVYGLRRQSLPAVLNNNFCHGLVTLHLFCRFESSSLASFARLFHLLAFPKSPGGTPIPIFRCRVLGSNILEFLVKT